MQIFDSNWPVLSPFYRSCTEQQRIDAVGLQPLAPLLDLFNDEANSSLSSLFHSLGVLSRQQLLHPIISLSVDVDPSSPSRQWLVLTQPSLSLPSLSLYSNSTLTSHLTSHIATLLRLTGLSPSRAAIHAERAVTIERLLSSISTPPSHLRNPLATFNPTNLSSLTTLAPHIPWPAFFAGLDLPLSSLSTPLNVAVPSYLSSLSSLISTRPDIVPLLSSYACYRVLHAFAADLPTPFQAANFDFFGAELRGQKQPEPRWSVCVDRTVQQLSELSGRYFMLERFTTQQREGVERVIAAIKEALRKQLTRAGWLDDGTRARALHKLASVIDNIGGATAASTPSYDAVPLHSDTYLANLLLLRAFNSNRTFTRLSFPTSRRLWQMAASESNAYYEPTTNSINFFAGILQPPFWDASAPAVVNLGGLGMVVGHELSHAFDDEGRHYDGIGALREWWGKGAQEGFAERAGCVQEGYGGMGVGTSEGWERVDGRLTLGENLADNAGLQLAWAVWEGGEVGKGDAGELMRTMRPPVESEAQLFFLSFASDWCQKVRPQFAHIALQTDVHSPAVARSVNIALERRAGREGCASRLLVLTLPSLLVRVCAQGEWSVDEHAAVFECVPLPTRQSDEPASQVRAVHVNGASWLYMSHWMCSGNSGNATVMYHASRCITPRRLLCFPLNASA